MHILYYAMATMKVRLVRLVMFFGTIGLASHLSAASPEEKASDLRERYIKNFAKIRTIEFGQSTATDKPGVALRASPQARERVLWNRERKRLKWSKPATQEAYVIDGEAGTLMCATAGGTVFHQELDEVRDAALLDPTPFPGWLWRPEWLLPNAPREVREEDGAVVLVVGIGGATREVWLDADTGLLRRFTDTDSRGRTYREVVCTDWARTDGAWIPQTIWEELRGTRKTSRRKIVNQPKQVNGTFERDAFEIP